MTHSIRSRIKTAAKAALKTEDRFQVGCAVYKGGNLLASAANQMTKSHTAAQKHYNFPFPHAEYNAIRSVKSSCLKNCTLYVARVDKDGNYVMAKPCSCCQKMLKSHGIKTVYFTTGNGIEKIKL